MNFLPWHKSQSEKEKIINAELRQRRREIVEVMQENAKLRSRIEELESKHILWEEYKISHNLRHFALRALACWDGSDADKAVETMFLAADLLDGDQYNNNNMEDN